MSQTSLDWPSPVEVLNEGGRSPIVLLCDHASNHVPAEYAGLGLTAANLVDHIAWDPGAGEVTRRLSRLLDAPAFLGGYSRLLIDLNRPLRAASSIPVRSEATDIAVNRGLPAAERLRRQQRIFAPYHERIAAHLDARAAAGRATCIVSVHSFTPVFHGEPRRWHAGVLFGEARAFGMRLIARLGEEPSLVVGENEPYSVSVEDDYAVPVHGDARGIEAVLIEMRNDALRTADGCQSWVERLVRVLTPECGAPQRARAAPAVEEVE
jgi:predicted N-formylglutamate amidohydrolase